VAVSGKGTSLLDLLITNVGRYIVQVQGEMDREDKLVTVGQYYKIFYSCDVNKNAGLAKCNIRHHELFPNKIIPNIKIPNPKNGENPEHENPEIQLTQLTPFPPHLAYLDGKWHYWQPILTYPNLWAGLTQLNPFPPSPNLVPFPLTKPFGIFTFRIIT
jgi:hypothetical protein